MLHIKNLYTQNQQKTDDTTWTHNVEGELAMFNPYGVHSGQDK